MNKAILFFIFCFSFCQSQTVEIEYKYHELLRPKNLPRDEVHKLININNEKSYYIITKEQEIKTAILTDGSEKLRTHKNFENDSLYTVYTIGSRYVYTKETIPTLDWKIGKDIKEILGYPCKKATTEFRGRKYEAFFTEKIPTIDGPWKFSGLPGAILELYDVEKKITFDAIEVKISEKTENYDHLLSMLKAKKKRTYDEFEKIRVTSYFKMMADIRASLTNNSDAVSTFDGPKDYPQNIEVVDVEKYK